MYSKAQIFALAGSAMISTASAIPLQNRAAVNCHDVTTGLDPSCWATLNMTGWMNDWATYSAPKGGFGLAPDTSADSSASSAGTFASGGDTGYRKRAPAVCNAGELWSTCFLRLGLGKTGEDCSKLSNGASCPAPSTRVAPHTPQIFYGIQNIYAINAYLSTLYSALNNVEQSSPAAITAAATSAPGTPPVPYFSSASDPKALPVDTPLLTLLFKETGGEELPGAPNTPLAKYIEANKSTQTYTQKTSGSQLTLLMQDRLVDVLGKVMSDIPTFVAFAENGAFSTNDFTSLGGVVAQLAATPGEACTEC